MFVKYIANMMPKHNKNKISYFINKLFINCLLFSDLLLQVFIASVIDFQ